MIDPYYAFADGLAGFFVGLAGVGGGALMTPVLLLILGVSPTAAVATDLWFAAITKIVGAKVHHGAGNIDWQVVRRLWMGSLPVALLVVLLLVQGVHLVSVAWLGRAIGFVVLLTAAGLLVAPWLTQRARNRRIGHPAVFKAAQPGLTVAAGAVLGICVALTSVGAGALGSVMLLYLYPLRMTPHRLVATDIFHAVPLAVVAGSGYLLAGWVNWPMLISLLAGSLLTVVLGSRLAGKLPVRKVQIALAVVLIAGGIKVFS